VASIFLATTRRPTIFDFHRDGDVLAIDRFCFCDELRNDRPEHRHIAGFQSLVLRPIEDLTKPRQGDPDAVRQDNGLGFDLRSDSIKLDSRHADMIGDATAELIAIASAR
jgi:hypothetical protein